MNFGIKWECDLEKTNTSNFSIQKQGAPTRTHPAKDHRQERYVQQGVPQRELPVFLCRRCEPVPPAIGKLAFAQRSGAMKAPVGLLSDRTVLR